MTHELRRDRGLGHEKSFEREMHKWPLYGFSKSLSSNFKRKASQNQTIKSNVSRLQLLRCAMIFRRLNYCWNCTQPQFQSRGFYAWSAQSILAAPTESEIISVERLRWE